MYNTYARTPVPRQYMSLFWHIGVQNILYCALFYLFVFVLCRVYRMLAVSLDCLFLNAPSVFSNVYFDLGRT